MFLGAWRIIISAWIALVLFISPQAISAFAVDAVSTHLQEVAAQNHVGHQHEHHSHDHGYAVSQSPDHLNNRELASASQGSSHKHRHSPGEPEHEHSVPTTSGSVSVGTLAASSYSTSSPGLTPQMTPEFPEQDSPLSPYLSSVLRPPIS
jgi:hypothetical protein